MIDWLRALSSPIQLLLAVGLTSMFTIGVAIVFAGPLHRFRSARLEGEDPDKHLELALAALLTTFAFIAAFMLAQFWNGSIDARKAVVAESAAISSALAQVQILGPSAEPVGQAVRAYELSIETEQWPAMRSGNAELASKDYLQAAATLSAALGSAGAHQDAGEWQTLSNSVDALINDGGDRIAATPSEAIVRLNSLIGILALLSLIIATALAPAKRSVAFMGLLAISTSVAILYSLLFQASNPFLSGALSYLPSLYPHIP